jgi:hypothetical protein
MFTFIVELLSVILFVGCVWHAARCASRPFAQQWFITAYLFFFIRETIMQVWVQTYIYAPSILRIGAAPLTLGLLWGSVFYLAYRFALRFTEAQDPVRVAVLMFVIAASIALPIEATAAQLHWWLNQDPGRTMFGGVPLSAPLVWGGAAAIFYAVFSKVNAARLPVQGKLYALVTLAPAMSAAHLLYALALGFLG